ncbi:BTAD domain-containing putative transcriptional regulator [Streptomyces sp. NPDC058231]|uniref:AfsR/SARP family transcriptional regulator n=1 Tax=Streptomyces sp. NPDC058231 TaxID=3346392 RepID=UPI0036EB9C83
MPEPVPQPRRRGAQQRALDTRQLLLDAGFQVLAVLHARVVEAARDSLAGEDVDALSAAYGRLAHELLPEDRYADWAGERCRRLEALRDQLVPALAERLLTAGRVDEAVEVVRSAVDRSPADEVLNLLATRVWCDIGRPRQAIRQYHACREALADELGVRPGAELEALHSRALAALDAPPLAHTVPNVPLPPRDPPPRTTTSVRP